MISRFFIDRPIFANVIALVTIILGLVCFFVLPVSQYPPIVPPTIQISTYFPGANAEVVAATVGIPIEQAVNGVEGSIYMSSTSSSDGTYTLTITFEIGTNLNNAVSLVQNLVNSANAALPPVVQSQGVTVKKVSTDILLVVSVYAPDDRFDPVFLSNYAVINMQNPLARIPGVGQIRVVGAGPYSMRIWLNPEKLRDYHLTALDVVQAIRDQNIEVAAGQLGGPPVPPDHPQQFTITALGRLQDVAQFSEIIIKSPRSESPQVVRLRDVARIELSQQSFSTFARMNGHPAAQILVFSQPGANAMEVAKNVRQAVAKMSKDFPEGLTYATHYDTTKFVEQAISSVYHTLFEAGLLVLLVIVLFLQDWRATLVPATTVPVTIIGAFAAMAMLGFGINLLTLFALVLSIGIVVDDAIVIVENASFHIEQGLPPKEATIKAMEEMTGPVLGITLVLAAVFLPAAFLPGITGPLFRQFALVIAAIALLSAINALTLKPTQCALWLRPRQPERRRNIIFRGFNLVYSFMEDFYVAMVARMVRRPGVMVVIFLIIMGVTTWLFAKHPTGFLPDEDQGYAIIITRLPDAASQPRVQAAAERISHVLQKTPGLKAWVTIGGFSVLDFANVSNFITTFTVFEDWQRRGSALRMERLVNIMRQELASIEEALIFVATPPPIRGLGSSGGFQLMIEDRGGLGFQELQNAVQGVIGVATGQPGLGFLATTFSANTPQIFLDIDRTKVHALQVPIRSVFDTLQAYLGSAFVNLFNKFNQVFQVYVQADAPFRLSTDDIKELYVRNVMGQMVPLGALLTVRQTVGPELVLRYNLYPAAQVFGTAALGFSTGQALRRMEQVLEATLPRGIAYDWTATAYQEKKVGPQAYFIYALSLTLVFMVLAALYESWTSPAAIILTVPLALVGVVLSLIIRMYDNNLYTQVGLVLMIALASKNAILIVEFARELYQRGMGLTEAAVEATRRRFRPILMTSFTFILGVMPLLLAGGAGAASRRAIGTVVFGGMISSTLLAIPFVPVFFVIMQRLEDRWRQRRAQARD
ncbi:MAG: efflux RND transporter permease subunit [Desulfobacca sp.]|uniref:efflux RND transporter permease subunit n=1 Tax=Desulfobacca sp. TaxID=2067990 RepID=UPI00404A8D84